MKRFEFRLERLLQIKKQLERMAEHRQQQAQVEFEAATGRVVLAERRVSEAGSGGLEALHRAAEIGLWQTRYEFVAVLEQAVTAAQKNAKEFLQRLLAAKLARTQVAKEVEVLIRLRHERLSIHREEVKCEEYARLDEIGMRRWLANSNTEGGGGSTQEDDG